MTERDREIEAARTLKMAPRQCVAIGCSEKQCMGSAYSFHKFPKDPKLLHAWLVNINRLDTLTKKLWRPKGKQEVLCSKHFTPDSFTMRSMMMRQKYSLCSAQLKPDAVPTLFAHKRQTGTVRPAYAKRRKNEVSTFVELSGFSIYRND